MNEFEEKIDHLAQGMIENIEVTSEKYFLFREAWLKREDRESFVGEAHHKGSITYRYIAVQVLEKE